MKSFQITGLLLVAALSSFSQSPKNSFVSSVSKGDRMAIVKNSIELTEWHEKSFWAQYNTYLNKMQEVASHTYLSMEEVAAVGRDSDTTVAVEKVHRMLNLRRNALDLTRDYFVEIGQEHNGVIALQFLQTESQLNMMESLNVYEQTYLRGFRLNPRFAATAKILETKYNVISKSMNITPREAEVFYPIYSRYLAECNDILGNDYTLYELFVGEASDYSAGLAKRLGYDLLTVMKRELDLKEKYYEEVRRRAGPVVAARFMAWEDYYSVICKMTVWADSN